MQIVSRHVLLEKKRILLILFFVMTFAFSIAIEGFAQIAIGPSRFEIDLDEKPTTQTFEVYNYKKNPVEINVSVFNWTLNDSNEVSIIPPTDQSLDQWFVINPTHFVVPPQKTQFVRFSIRPKVKPEPGEHRAIVYFTEVPSDSNTASVQVTSQIGIAVYGYAGEINRSAKFHELRVEPDSTGVYIKMDISNQGNAHVRLKGQYAVWPDSLYPGNEQTSQFQDMAKKEFSLPEPIITANFLPITPILPGARRTISFPLKTRLEPGNYILDINAAVGDSTVIDQGWPFEVHPW